MAVAIEYRLSGGGSNADPAASLGGAMSSSAVSASLNAFFDLVGSAEAAAGDVEYRCLYVVNTGTTTALGAKLWIQSNTPNSDNDIAIALDGGGLDATAEGPVANEGTAPSGESFSAPSSEGAALSLGDMAQNAKYPVWVRRTVNAGAAADASEQFTLRVKYDYVP